MPPRRPRNSELLERLKRELLELESLKLLAPDDLPIVTAKRELRDRIAALEKQPDQEDN